MATDHDGYKHVAYDRITAVLLEAVKAQQKEIKKQEEKSEGQEKEIQALKMEVEKFKKPAN